MGLYLGNHGAQNGVISWQSWGTEWGYQLAVMGLKMWSSTGNHCAQNGVISYSQQSWGSEWGDLLAIMGLRLGLSTGNHGAQNGVINWLKAKTDSSSAGEENEHETQKQMYGLKNNISMYY